MTYRLIIKTFLLVADRVGENSEKGINASSVW